MEYIGGTLTLNKGWQAYKVAPGAIDTPDESLFTDREAFSIDLPGSIHASLTLAGNTNQRADHFDWWYRLELDAVGVTGKVVELSLDRLATFADVWLNGELIGESKNFFTPLRLIVTSKLQAKNFLYVCFKSVHAFLHRKFPRPKWKTNLVDHQNLRWVRTSLLGRIPAWTPALPPIGPCGEIILKETEAIALLDFKVRTCFAKDVGVVEVYLDLSNECENVELHFGPLSIDMDQGSEEQHERVRYTAKFKVEAPLLWWPHTAGEPNLYAVSVRCMNRSSGTSFDLGKKGFKALEFGGDHGLHCQINGESIFLRGGCWTVLDLERFWSSESDYRKVLARLRDAGVNLIRVGGTMQYEQDEFYNLCDELGILVWQDFMFANMDYPVDDAAFLENIKSEVDYQVARLSEHTCVAIYCGGSEVQQQAAMMGVSKEYWSNHFYDDVIPSIIEAKHKGVPYFPSSPCGGDLPFHIGDGITHFYGVGAYQMDLLGSGVDSVGFASECLGFSHIPEPKAIEKLFDGGLPMCHSPVWKAGVPRDNGAGLDFEDVRDHYVNRLFGVDAVKLRSQDTHHYLSISRVVTGELSKQVMGRWRDNQSNCGGGVIWNLQDIVPGAGWGVLDNDGNPKAAYYQISKALQPLSAFLLDKGLDGLDVLVVNDASTERELQIEIKLISNNRVLIDTYEGRIQIAKRSQWKTGLDGLLGLFRDSTFNYKFGARQHEVVSLNVFDKVTKELLAEDVYFVESMQLPKVLAPHIELRLVESSGGVALEITSDSFLQFVSFEFSKGILAKDAYFHLIPGVQRSVPLEQVDQSVDLVKGYLTALNLSAPLRIRTQRQESS